VRTMAVTKWLKTAAPGLAGLTVLAALDTASASLPASHAAGLPPAIAAPPERGEVPTDEEIAKLRARLHDLIHKRTELLRSLEEPENQLVDRSSSRQRLELAFTTLIAELAKLNSGGLGPFESTADEVAVRARLFEAVRKLEAIDEQLVRSG